MLEEEAKRLAAQEAVRLLPDEGVIGLGTGSTAKYFIDALAVAVRQGKRLRGVPTSEASRAQAEALGIELLLDAGPWSIDLCVDGADEVDADLDLIKGGGGSHTREKIVNFASKRNVIVVDERKLSRRLGEKWPVPVEILEFGWRATMDALSQFGSCTRRCRGDHEVRTDCGNFICDVKVGPMSEPALVDGRIRAIPGVVETGLFCGRADVVIVAGVGGVRTLTKGG